jgi:hypothetical protein
LNNIHKPPIINLGESLTTLAHDNIRVKRKHNYYFSLFIESTNKNNKVMVDVMEKIDFMQLEIEQRCSKN